MSYLNFAFTLLSKPGHGVVVVACLQGVFYVSSLIAASSLGSCSLRKQFIFASRGVCTNGWKTALWMFPNVTQSCTSCTFDGFCDDSDRGESGFVRLKARAPGMTAEICWERIYINTKIYWK